MDRLEIDYKFFRVNPQILFEEMQKTGMDGCIYYCGHEYVVKSNLQEAANDPAY